MKKITALLIASALCLSAIVLTASCTGMPEADTGDSSADTSADTVTSADATETQPATGEQADEQTETAPGTESGSAVEYSEVTLKLYSYNSEHKAVDANNGKELGGKFKVEDGCLLTGITFESCPTWNTDGEQAFTVELYKWDNDFETTIDGDALFTKDFEAWTDNAACEIDFTSVAENGFKAGTYMWVFRGRTATVGLWAQDPTDEYKCEYFENGVTCENGYEVHITVLKAE